MRSKIQSTTKYFDLYGLRKEKSEFLEMHDIKNTKWQELKIKEPHYFFVPKDFRMEKIYSKFISVKEIFNVLSTGVKTHRDEIIVKSNSRELRAILDIFYNKDNDDDYVKEYFKFKDNSSRFQKMRKEYIKKGIKEDLFIDYNYRIFDTKTIYFDNYFITRLREKFMESLLRDNISIVTTRILSSNNFEHVFISDLVSDICYLSNRGKESNYYFPLYLYNTSPYIQKDKKTNLSYKNLMIFDKPKEKESNIKTEIVEKLSTQYKKKISPEEIFYYIYGILYSDIYREKYQEFLKIDFPKIPFTNDYKLFQKAAKFGKELIDLHLLKSDKLKKSIAKFPKTGDSRIEKREYNEKEKRIYINGKQYFEGVKSEVWNYHIGGYQVLDKWLKDRTGKILSAEDANHYLKIISTLKYTMDLQKQIDKIYFEVEKNLIEK